VVEFRVNIQSALLLPLIWWFFKEKKGLFRSRGSRGGFVNSFNVRSGDLL